MRSQKLARTLALVTVALVLAACGSDPTTQPPAGIGKEVYTFDSLDELVATSPVAVLGRVRSVEPGRELGSDEGTWSANLATMSVEQVLIGDVPNEIYVEETGTNGVPYLEQGERVVLFLLPYKGDSPNDGVAPFFVNIGSQGRFVVEADSTVTPANHEASWINELRGIPLESLLDLVTRASDIASRRATTTLGASPGLIVSAASSG